MSAVIAGVVAGVLSRGVMRVASLIDAAPGVQGFSWEGSVRLIRDVVLLYSAPAALLFAVARRLLPGSWLRKGVLFGGLLFLVFLVAQLGPERLLVKFLFALIAIIYGVTLAFLVTELETRARRWIRLSSSDRMALCGGPVQSARSPPRRRPSVDGMADDGLVVGRQLGDHTELCFS